MIKTTSSPSTPCTMTPSHTAFSASAEVLNGSTPLCAPLLTPLSSYAGTLQTLTKRLDHTVTDISSGTTVS